MLRQLAITLLFGASALVPRTAEPLTADIAALSFGKTYSNVPVGFGNVSGGGAPDIFVDVFRGMKDDLGLWVLTPDGMSAPGDAGSFNPYDGPSGNPVYRKAGRFSTPWKPDGNGKVFQDGADLWLVKATKSKLLVARWDGGTSFVKYCEKPLTGLGRGPECIDLQRIDPQTVELVFAMSDGQVYRPDFLNNNTESLYDGAGIYRGNFPLCGVFRILLSNDWTQKSDVLQVSGGMDVTISGSSIACVRGDGFDGYVIANSLGAMKYLPRDGGKHDLLRNSDGTAFTFRCHGARTISVPGADGSRSRLIIGGECAIYEHDCTGNLNGTPRFGNPLALLERNAPLYGGSLTVPNVVDWDGDGVLDIVAGNSEARLLFFKNNGTDRKPVFGLPVELKADGATICLRAGYYIVQGPYEGAWGYLCPTVYDWNGDGLPDVVVSGSKAKYEVFLNVGTRTEPRLAAPFTLRCDGLDLHGVWRVRPAIAEIDGCTCILIMDDDDAIHMYRKVDDRTVEDAGKVLLADGGTITGHNSGEGENLGYGQWGRGKLRLFDWDGDGDMDLFVGTIKRSCYPSPDDGLPYRRYKQKQNGMQVLFFENLGGFRFAAPKQAQVGGEDFYLGAHSNAPEPCLLGDTSHGPNLLVGCESGKYFFFNRKDITWIQ